MRWLKRIYIRQHIKLQWQFLNGGRQVWLRVYWLSALPLLLLFIMVLAKAISWLPTTIRDIAVTFILPTALCLVVIIHGCVFQVSDKDAHKKLDELKEQYIKLISPPQPKDELLRPSQPQLKDELLRPAKPSWNDYRVEELLRLPRDND